MLIADDHEMVRKGMRLLLAQEDDIAVCGEAKSASEAEALAASLQPDVAILDYVLPGMDGATLTRRVRVVAPQTRVLLVTGSDRVEFVAEALSCGADGYLLKNAGPETLIDAVRVIAAGEVFVAREIGQAYAPRAAQEELTPRESAILDFIAAGFSNSQIAHRLDLSVFTIRTHRQNLMRKLELHNTAELTAYAIRRGGARNEA